MKNTGLVYVFTGDGKGKTSAAIGTATRSLLNGERVVWIAFYKQESWGLSEAKLKDKFANLEMMFVGKGFRITKPEITKGKIKLATVGESSKVVDTASEEEHKSSVRDGLATAKEKLEEHPFLLVLDEVLNAVAEGLFEEREILDFLQKRGATNLVLTGRGATKNVIDQADLVTECRKIKHPYDLGQLAVKGLDF